MGEQKIVLQYKNIFIVSGHFRSELKILFPF